MLLLLLLPASQPATPGFDSSSVPHRRAAVRRPLPDTIQCICIRERVTRKSSRPVVMRPIQICFVGTSLNWRGGCTLRPKRTVTCKSSCPDDDCDWHSIKSVLPSSSFIPRFLLNADHHHPHPISKVQRASTKRQTKWTWNGCWSIILLLLIHHHHYTSSSSAPFPKHTYTAIYSPSSFNRSLDSFKYSSSWAPNARELLSAS